MISICIQKSLLESCLLLYRLNETICINLNVTGSATTGQIYVQYSLLN